MMISPESYMDSIKEASYEELIEERDGLIRFLKEYEEHEKFGDRTGPEWMIHPQPDVRYQVYMDYLAELIPYMRDKYNQEYVWGEKSLANTSNQNNNPALEGNDNE